jgi:large subunit ribosomal protein L4
VKEGRFTVVDSIDLGVVKTKKLAGVLVALQTPKKTLVVDDKGNENLRLSIRNIQQSQFLPPEGVNVYDLLRHDHLVVSKQAAKALEARCKAVKS